ncbi:MAG: CapA family protein [Deltaproteobacteria bacterium]|nr:CapA family protein [Deltaproteobacteria bacterium]
MAGGDVSFGRERGQLLLRDPDRDDFATLRALIDPADVRFVNIESTLSDQHGETGSPLNKLVFTGPPIASRSLERAHIDVVSLANNHAWDYGEAALRETFDHLDRAGIAYVGAGRSRAEAYAPRFVERSGFKLGFVAVTDIWNQAYTPHPGKELVADANLETMAAAIRQARAEPGVDAVILSYHGGDEYVDRPLLRQIEVFAAAVKAGADVVIGHHPHVVRRVEFVDGRPVLHSLGNLLMRMKTGAPWTELGMLARIVLRRGGLAPSVEICPYRLWGYTAIPLAADPKRQAYEAHFALKYGWLLRGSGTRMGAFGADGCAALLPPE